MKYAHNHHDWPDGRRHHHDGHSGRSGRGHGFDGFGFDVPGFGMHGFNGRPFGPGGRGPGGRGPRRANRGDVRSAILSLLADGPSSGYGLIKAIAQKTGGSWRPSPGSVYPTLQQLVDEELILATGDDRRTEYELSETGTTYVEENADELARAWESNPGPTEADVALFSSVGKLMGVIHQLRMATDEQRGSAIEKLDETRRALYLILAE